MSAAPDHALTCTVVGAGLGGLSAAIGLRRAGHAVTVLEQADRLGEVGAGIQLAPNASRLLHAWGVVDRLLPEAVAAEAAVRRRWQDGRVLGAVAMGDRLADEFGAAYWCAHRADVHAALVETATASDGAGTPVTILLDRAVTAVDPGGTRPATVEARNGPAARSDVVVAADGIKSVVRDQLFDPLVASFSGQVTNRMVIDVADLPRTPALEALVAHPAQNIWLGPGRHAITHPIRGGAGLYLGVTVEHDRDDEAFWSARADQRTLLDEMADWDPTLLDLIRAAPAVTAYGLHDSEPLARWTVGRVALLGDACHAMLPFQAQGAAQAVEDGAVLAQALTGVAADGVADALVRYADLRQPRTTRVQQASRGNGGAFHLPDGPEQEERDRNLGEGSGDFRSYDWLWSVGPDAAPAPQTTAIG